MLATYEASQVAAIPGGALGRGEEAWPGAFRAGGYGRRGPHDRRLPLDSQERLAEIFGGAETMAGIARERAPEHTLEDRRNIRPNGAQRLRIAGEALGRDGNPVLAVEGSPPHQQL